MGCDIHPVIQYWESYGNGEFGYWRNAGIPDNSRCYPFFAALAGVREYDNNFEPICEPRGLPPDLEDYDIKALYDGDILSHEHTPTWVTLAEMKAYDATPLKSAYPDSDWPHEQWQRWIEFGEFVVKHFESSDEHVRFVMDFDS